jgi:hypothetical protein
LSKLALASETRKRAYSFYERYTRLNHCR